MMLILEIMVIIIIMCLFLQLLWTETQAAAVHINN